MDLTKYNFPKKSINTQVSNELLNEAKQRGFYNGRTPYNKLFSNLFFKGGNPKFKQGLDETFKSEAWAYCKSLMRSFAPSHEEKEAVCALIMSEILELD